MKQARKRRKGSIHRPYVCEALAALLVIIGLILVLLTGCSGFKDVATLETGLTRGEVRGVLGEPNQTQEFTLPEAPSFGPQESLTGLLDPGTAVREWAYIQENHVVYVWFVRESEEAQDVWTVISFAEYPADAVY